MKTIQVTYERAINLGNYNSEKIGVVLAPDFEHSEQPEEQPEALLKQARKLVATHTDAYLKKALAKTRRDEVSDETGADLAGDR